MPLSVILGCIMIGLAVGALSSLFGNWLMRASQTLDETRYSGATFNQTGQIEVVVKNRQWLDLFITQQNVTPTITSMTIPIRLSLSSVIQLLNKLNQGLNFLFDDENKVKGLHAHELDGRFVDIGLRIYLVELTDSEHIVSLNLDTTDQEMLTHLLLMAAADMTSET